MIILAEATNEPWPLNTVFMRPWIFFNIIFRSPHGKSIIGQIQLNSKELMFWFGNLNSAQVGGRRFSPAHHIYCLDRISLIRRLEMTAKKMTQLHNPLSQAPPPSPWKAIAWEQTLLLLIYWRWTRWAYQPPVISASWAAFDIQWHSKEDSLTPPSAHSQPGLNVNDCEVHWRIAGVLHALSSVHRVGIQPCEAVAENSE